MIQILYRIQTLAILDLELNQQFKLNSNSHFRCRSLDALESALGKMILKITS